MRTSLPFKEMRKELTQITLRRRSAFPLGFYLTGDLSSVLSLQSLQIGSSENDISSEDNKERIAVIATLTENISSLGYTLDKNIIDVLLLIDKEEIITVGKAIIDSLREFLGDKITYEPMYPGFPAQVMNASDAMLRLDAIIYAISGFTITPDIIHGDRATEIVEIGKSYTTLKKLNIIKNTEIEKIFLNLISSKVPLSESDRDDLTFYFNNLYSGAKLPEIELKENLAFVAKEFYESGYFKGDVGFTAISGWFNTATDILRFFVAISGGDISLTRMTERERKRLIARSKASGKSYEPFRFNKLSHTERTLFMRLLLMIPDKQLLEDFARYKEYWKKAGAKIKPNSYKGPKYKKVRDAFYMIRNNVKIKTWKGSIDELCREGRIKEMIELYAQRPGEFARSLDYLLRSSNDEMQKEILNQYLAVLPEIGTRVLLSVMTHFINRFSNNKDVLYFKPKSTRGVKVYSKKNTREDIDPNYSIAIARMTRHEYENRLRSKGWLGKVFVDESIKGYLAPMSERNSSKSMFPCVRGSKIPLHENTKIVRAFTKWNNTTRNQIVDIDLAVSIRDDKFNLGPVVNFHTLQNLEYGIVHSGDTRTGAGPNGGAEFVDIDVDRVAKHGGRYVVIQLNLYASHFYPQGFKTEGMNVTSGIIELVDYTELVSHRMSVDSESDRIMTIAIDCLNKCMIWLDIPSTEADNRGFNVTGDEIQMPVVLQSLLNESHLTLLDLIDMNINARGIRVSNKDEADIIFSKDEGITPFMLDKFMSEFM